MFSKLNFHVPEESVKRIVLSTAGAIEPILNALREKIQKKLEHTTDNILGCTVCLCKCGCLNAIHKINKLLGSVEQNIVTKITTF